MSICTDNLRAAMSITTDFEDADKITLCSDEILSVCNMMDLEGKEMLSPYLPKLKAIKEDKQAMRASIEQGSVPDELIAPFMKGKDDAGKKVLRTLIGFAVGIIGLIVGLCVLFAVDSNYLQSNKALGYFGIIMTVIGAVFAAIGIYNFVGYCIIYSRNSDRASRLAQLRKKAIAQANSKLCAELSLVDMLIAAATSDIDSAVSDGTDIRR